LAEGAKCFGTSPTGFRVGSFKNYGCSPLGHLVLSVRKLSFDV
jgi:hypothetical protein